MAESAPFKELPPEVWKLILSNLTDHADLLTCRLVSPTMKDLASEVLRYRESSSIWKVTFGKSSKVTSGRLGTRFSTEAEIKRFMAEVKGSTNPFPSGTVIFAPDQLTIYHRSILQAKFWKLLDKFKEGIFTLVYVIEGIRVPKEMDLLAHQFRSILNLKNLRNLVIVKAHLDWGDASLSSLRSQELFKEMLEEGTVPEKLTQIHIHGLDGVIPLTYMFGGVESIVKSTTSLEISNKYLATLPHPDPDERVDYPMCQFPKLRRIKVRYPNAKFLQQFQQFQPNCKASLKEVSICFKEMIISPLVLNLREIFALLDYHAETLELLHLDFGHLSIDWEWVGVDATGLYTSVKYTKLKTLVLRYNISLLEMSPIISQLFKKVENLEKLELVLPDPEPRDMPITVSDWSEIHKNVMAFWNHLPATVKVINVPDFGWVTKREEALQSDQGIEGNRVRHRRRPPARRHDP